jgi:filamentous hemagglutinin
VLTSSVVSAAGNIIGSNILTNGTVSATGNITSAGTINGANLSITGQASVAGNIAGGNLVTTGAVTATGDVSGANIFATGNVIPTANLLYTLGNTTNSWKSLYLGDTIHLGNLQVKELPTGVFSVFLADGVTPAETRTGPLSAAGNVTGGNIETTGLVTATGTVTGGNIATAGTASVSGTATVGNLNTGGTVSAIGNISTANTIIAASAVIGNISISGDINVANITATGTASIAGTVTGGNIATAGFVSATGDVTGGNIATAGTVSATGTVTGGNVSTAGTITATGTITGGNVVTGGIVSVAGDVTGGNVFTGGQISAQGNIQTSGSFSATGNVQGANILTSGNISATGNVTAANFIGNVSGNISAPGANTDVIFNDNGTVGANAGFTFDKTTNVVSTTGAFSTTGNVDAANFNGGNLVNMTLGSQLLTNGYRIAGGAFDYSQLFVGFDGGDQGIAVNSFGNAPVQINTGDAGANTYNWSFTADTGAFNAPGDISAVGNIIGADLILTLGAIDGPVGGSINFNSSGLDIDFAVNGLATSDILYIDAGTSTASFGNSIQTVNSIVSFNATNSIVLPVGNTVQRPTGVTGQFRFNTTLNSLEVYNNSEWISIGSNELTLITDQQFAGDGSTVVFTLSANTTTAGAIVSINGVTQIPTTSYAVSNNVLTFTEAPEIGDQIDVRTLSTTTSVNEITNVSGNASISVTDTSNVVTVTGDLLVTGNATITGNVATNQISNGTSAVQIPTVNGNVNIDVGTADNMAVFATSGLFVTGNISATGDVVAQNVNSLSDVTLKANIRPIANADQIIKALQGVGYDWADGSGHAFGLIAQAVEQVIPAAVKTNETGIKSVNYNMVIPFLIELSKLQSQEIAELKDIVYQLLAK